MSESASRCERRLLRTMDLVDLRYDSEDTDVKIVRLGATVLRRAMFTSSAGDVLPFRVGNVLPLFVHRPT